jgi:hypothetical protein
VKATQRERQTEAHILKAKRTAGVAARNRSASEAALDLSIEELVAVMALDHITASNHRIRKLTAILSPMSSAIAGSPAPTKSVRLRVLPSALVNPNIALHGGRIVK